MRPLGRADACPQILHSLDACVFVHIERREPEQARTDHRRRCRTHRGDLGHEQAKPSPATSHSRLAVKRGRPHDDPASTSYDLCLPPAPRRCEIAKMIVIGRDAEFQIIHQRPARREKCSQARVKPDCSFSAPRRGVDFAPTEIFDGAAKTDGIQLNLHLPAA